MSIYPWYVLTGAPCSGKTTLIAKLAERGHNIIAEASRPYLEAEMAKGRTLEEIRSGDNEGYQRTIAEIRLRNEAAGKKEALSFLDRALPDSIAYYRINGFNPQWILDACGNYRYKGIFFLERLKLENDSVRWEDDAQTRKTESALAEAYTGLSYELVRVPVMPVEERLEFILARLKKD